MRKRYILSIVTALGVAGYLTLNDNQDNSFSGNIDNTQQEADFIIKGMISATYGKDGSLSQQLDATSAKHYPEGLTQLEQPDMIIYSEQQASWGVKAKQGKIKQHNEIDLIGDVQAIPLVNDGSQFSLQTQILHINASNQTAQTSEAVIIESDVNRINATGMNLNLKNQTATFDNQVRGVHVPNKN